MSRQCASSARRLGRATLRRAGGKEEGRERRTGHEHNQARHRQKREKKTRHRQKTKEKKQDKSALKKRELAFANARAGGEEGRTRTVFELPAIVHGGEVEEVELVFEHLPDLRSPHRSREP